MAETRRVLVTGATGFVGRRLVAACLADQVEVRAYARRPVTLPDVDVCVGDLGDVDALVAAMGAVTGSTTSRPTPRPTRIRHPSSA